MTASVNEFYHSGMSVISNDNRRNLNFYLSGPQPCPYLPGHIERNLFTRIESADSDANAEVNAVLCRAGFRRSHDVIYRPACVQCNACVPIRIPVDQFNLSRSLRRTIARNNDLQWQRIASEPTPELYALFTRYQRSRHGDSDMARMGVSDFTAMLREGHAKTWLYALRDAENILRGCMIADPVGDGLSAVYSFFDPDQPKRSLGTFLILSLVVQTKQLALPYVYLGYWIAKSPKMAYKIRFCPLERLDESGWRPLELSTPSDPCTTHTEKSDAP